MGSKGRPYRTIPFAGFEILVGKGDVQNDRLTFDVAELDDPRRRRPDVSKARHPLGWTPTTPLELGLTKTIKYFDELFAQSSPRS